MCSGLRAAGCGTTYLGANGCPSNVVGFAAADTGNGLQRWRLTYVAGTNGVFDVRDPFSLIFIFSLLTLHIALLFSLLWI